MRKVLPKMLGAIFSLIVAVITVVAISYAWVTLSSSPTAEGIQMTIGGGNTILIAADITEICSDGTVLHYPGKFDNKLLFGQYESYNYLSELGYLSPVSTADGINWVFPEYFKASDPEVQNGSAMVGELKPISAFSVDSELSRANPKSGETGGYVYVDFWVVSPGSDYTLRISRGDETGGSYVIDLMNPVKADKDSDGTEKSYTLSISSQDAAASARVGFLVNDEIITDATMEHYIKSPAYNQAYSKLKGVYGTTSADTSSNRFTIYEPNGDVHPNGESGTYYVTFPMSWNGSEIGLADISDRLTVQLASSWKNSNTGVSLEQLFQTAIAGKKLNSAEDARYEFYQKYLQNQLFPYVNKGYIFQSTSSLYSSADANGIVSADKLKMQNLAGATDDVYIAKLTKNVPQKIRMFIWIEGQDIDCTEAVSALDLGISIELAGSN